MIFNIYDIPSYSWTPQYRYALQLIPLTGSEAVTRQGALGPRSRDSESLRRMGISDVNPILYILHKSVYIME